MLKLFSTKINMRTTYRHLREEDRRTIYRMNKDGSTQREMAVAVARVLFPKSSSATVESEVTEQAKRKVLRILGNAPRELAQERSLVNSKKSSSKEFVLSTALSKSVEV